MKMRRIRIGILTLCAATAFSALVSVGSGAAERSLTIFFSGEVQGNYEPCGCTAGPTGGLSRRKGYSDHYMQQNGGASIHVDAGNYFLKPGPTSQLVNELMLIGLSETPVQVMNLGADDLFWWKGLKDASSTSTEFISTNLEPLNPADRKPERYAIVEIDGSRLGLRKNVRIGFLGITDPSKVKPNSRFRGRDPLEAIEAVKAEVLKSADFLVVLADLPRPRGELPKESPLFRIAETNPEIYAILVTEREFVLYDPVQVNSAVILSGVERGRFLGQLTFGFDETGNVTSVAAEHVELQDGVPEHGGLLREQGRVSEQIR